MQYRELKELADRSVQFTSNRNPQDAFHIAKQLNIRLKNSSECKIDFGADDYPLIRRGAVYALHEMEYTIYYDEKRPYLNYSIALEIAHHLLDPKLDGANKHLDADLLAAIIVAPSQYIHGIKSAMDLAMGCQIPIDVAVNYWQELKEAGEIEGNYTDHIRALKNISATRDDIRLITHPQTRKIMGIFTDEERFYALKKEIRLVANDAADKIVGIFSDDGKYRQWKAKVQEYKDNHTEKEFYEWLYGWAFADDDMSYVDDDTAYRDDDWAIWGDDDFNIWDLENDGLTDEEIAEYRIECEIRRLFRDAVIPLLKGESIFDMVIPYAE